MVEGREREDAERRQSKTEPSTASTVSPSQSRESRFDGDAVVGETTGSAMAGDARPAETAVKAEGDRRPSNAASDSRVSVDGSGLPPGYTTRSLCAKKRSARVRGAPLSRFRGGTYQSAADGAMPTIKLRKDGDYDATEPVLSTEKTRSSFTQNTQYFPPKR